MKRMNDFQYPTGATPLDPEEIEGLKIGHITTRQELNRFEQENINEAIEWLGIRRKGNILTEKFIKTLHHCCPNYNHVIPAKAGIQTETQNWTPAFAGVTKSMSRIIIFVDMLDLIWTHMTLHQKMFGKVWRWAGTFRRSGKNIGVDWVQIPVHLHTLLQDVRYWVEHKTYPSDEIALRFHHKLVWIHLFPNGNGRHGRLMTDILLKDIFKQEPFTWNIKNIDVGDNVRSFYLKALRAADQGDYTMLLEFVRSNWGLL